MKLTVTIKMDNAAFFAEDDSETVIGGEAARILTELAENLDETVLDIGDSFNLSDINVNKVGTAKVTR